MIVGIYPIGSAFRNNITIYYYDNGIFYISLAGGPLIRRKRESRLNGLCDETIKVAKYGEMINK